MTLEEFGRYMLDTQCANSDDTFTFELHCCVVEVRYDTSTNTVKVLNDEH